MKWTRSIRTRFALWATALILVLLVAFGGFVYASLSHGLRAAVDDSLSLSAAQAAASLNVDNGRILVPEAISPEETGADAFGPQGLTLIVRADDGGVLQATGPYAIIQGVGLTADARGDFITVRSAVGDPLRIFTLPVLDNERLVGWVQSAQSLGEVESALERLLTALFLGGGLAAMLAGFAGYFLAARALAPIDAITRAARRISTEDLSARLKLPDVGDEVSRLATTFDDMLNRLDQGFQRERRFTADASHELHTPLAAMQAILSVMREAERSPAEYRQAMSDLAEETDRMRGLVEDLMRLARGEGESPVMKEPIDLALLLLDVTDSLRPLAGGKGLRLELDTPNSLPIRGDMDQLIRLWVNLIHNAIKYTISGTISVSAHAEADRVVVYVQDTGVGIPAEHLPHIFERFYRVEAARSSAGTGLGLAIARQIVTAHGGSVSVESTPGVGSRFTVSLPT